MTKNQIVTDVTMYVIPINGVRNIAEGHIVGIVMSEPNLSKMENKNYEIEKLKGCAIVRPHTHEDIMAIKSCSEKIVHKDIPTVFDINTVMEHLNKELKLADDEKSRCIKENPMQFDEVKGYARGIATAIEIVKGSMNNEIN